MVQLFRPLVMRKLKSSMEFDRMNSSKQSNASYHRPTITYLSYKNTVTSARGDPVSRSSSQRSLCGRYHNSVDTKRQKDKASKFPPLTNFLEERAAKSVKKVFKIKKEQHYSLLTLKALQIRKIPDEEDATPDHHRHVSKEKDSGRKKSTTSASVDPVKFNEASSSSFMHHREPGEDTEAGADGQVEYLYINGEKLAEDLIHGANSSEYAANPTRRNSTAGRRNSTSRAS
jgi:hypothetical protein